MLFDRGTISLKLEPKVYNYVYEYPLRSARNGTNFPLKDEVKIYPRRERFATMTSQKIISGYPFGRDLTLTARGRDGNTLPRYRTYLYNTST